VRGETAQIGNDGLPREQPDFPETVQVFLEENYRSTGAILEASLEIVSQGKRGLAASHFPP
jgi:DNA helicase-2/ATP-dependent DNA helicase PcrA